MEFLLCDQQSDRQGHVSDIHMDGVVRSTIDYAILRLAVPKRSYLT